MRPESPLHHAKHVVRAALALVVGVVVIVLGRSFFVPETWGQFGSYRGSNVSEQMAQPVRHGGNESCRACHEDQYDELASAGHESLECESCHAAVAQHARDDEKIADMPIQRDLELCLTCHRQLDARPPSFPQIHAKQHIAENEGEFTEDACLECHEAHWPL
jgi:hypothetical protein